MYILVHIIMSPCLDFPAINLQHLMITLRHMYRLHPTRLNHRISVCVIAFNLACLCDHKFQWYYRTRRVPWALQDLEVVYVCTYSVSTNIKNYRKFNNPLLLPTLSKIGSSCSQNTMIAHSWMERKRIAIKLTVLSRRDHHRT